MAWTKLIESVISCGISLHDLGVNNWALNKEQALRALDSFEAQGVPVLGGDVYEIIDRRPQSNYDNWYCNRDNGEVIEDYVTRSIAYARKYINNYKNPSGRDVLFVLVAQ